MLQCQSVFEAWHVSAGYAESLQSVTTVCYGFGSLAVCAAICLEVIVCVLWIWKSGCVCCSMFGSHSVCAMDLEVRVCMFVCI